jgi:hypothetical protein
MRGPQERKDPRESDQTGKLNGRRAPYTVCKCHEQFTHCPTEVRTPIVSDEYAFTLNPSKREPVVMDNSFRYPPTSLSVLYPREDVDSLRKLRCCKPGHSILFQNSRNWQ